MLRFLADENFNEHILRGLERRIPGLDVARVRDVGLANTPDPLILEWAARENRILLTHDLATMPDFAADRIHNGLPMPGVAAVNFNTVSIGAAIEDLVVLAECGKPEDLENKVEFLPL